MHMIQCSSHPINPHSFLSITINITFFLDVVCLVRDSQITIKILETGFAKYYIECLDNSCNFCTVISGSDGSGWIVVPDIEGRNEIQ